MQGLDPPQAYPQLRFDRLGARSSAVSLPSAVSDHHYVTCAVEILEPQRRTLRHSKAGAASQQGDPAVRARQLYDRPRMSFRSGPPAAAWGGGYRSPFRSTGMDVLHELDNEEQGPLVSRGAHVLLYRQVSEKPVDFVGARLSGVTYRGRSWPALGNVAMARVWQAGAQRITAHRARARGAPADADGVGAEQAGLNRRMIAIQSARGAAGHLRSNRGV